jgi:hypothetical protein
MSESDCAYVKVRRQYDDSDNVATYRIEDFDGLHWSDISGGVQSHANLDYLCGYVWCNAAVEGAVSHSCQHGEGPHSIKVCVVKKDNAKSTYASLLALMDWECNRTRCPFVVDLGDLSGNLVDQWLHQHCSPDACVKVDFGWWKSAAGWSRKGHPKVRRFGSRASRTQKLLRPTSTRGCCITESIQAPHRCQLHVAASI